MERKRHPALAIKAVNVSWLSPVAERELKRGLIRYLGSQPISAAEAKMLVHKAAHALVERARNPETKAPAGREPDDVQSWVATQLEMRCQYEAEIRKWFASKATTNSTFTPRGTKVVVMN